MSNSCIFNNINITGWTANFLVQSKGDGKLDESVTITGYGALYSIYPNNDNDNLFSTTGIFQLNHKDQLGFDAKKKRDTVEIQCLYEKINLFIE